MIGPATIDRAIAQLAKSGNTDAVFFLLLFVLVVGTAWVVPWWAALGTAAFCAMAYHVRRTASERHAERMAVLSVEQEEARIAKIRERHQALMVPTQPPLPLETGARRLSGDQPPR